MSYQWNQSSGPGYRSSNPGIPQALGRDAQNMRESSQAREQREREREQKDREQSVKDQDVPGSTGGGVSTLSIWSKFDKGDKIGMCSGAGLAI